jgi:hypothetical protein
MNEAQATQFGTMQAKVDKLEKEVGELRDDVKSLLELANHSKGAFWASMSMASALGAIVSWLLTHWPIK